MTDVLGAYRASAAWVVALVDAVPADAWDGPGLGQWTLRGLVGHTSRSFVTVLERQELDAAAPEIASAGDYYRITTPISEGGGDDVVERGVAAGERLGVEPATEFRELATRALASIRDDRDPCIRAFAGSIRLSDYLLTRVFELMVHGLDIDHRIRSGIEPPAAPLALALNLATDLTVQSGRGAEALWALAGRSALPPGFSALAPPQPLSGQFL